MKTLTLITLFASTTLLALAGDKDVPPGLQKKGGLPPGQAKKQGASGASTVTNVVTVTNTVNVTNAVPAATTVRTAPTTPTAPATTKVPGTPTAPAATTPALARVDLDKRAKAINTLDNKDAARKAGLEAIAKETGVKVAALQSQRREHEGMGTAGLLVANVIAAKTKKPAGTYLKERMEGKSWERIAAENKVSMTEIDAKLARVEAAMASVK